MEERSTRKLTIQVISYSIPFKNIDIDPNELATWDDGLIEAWQGDQRFTMLIRADKYGASPDQMQFFLLMDPNCQSFPLLLHHDQYVV